MYPQPQRTNVNEITQQIIGAAIAIHRALGPGLLESAYQECLCRELTLRGIPLERQVPIPLEYRGIQLGCGYRLDILDRQIPANLDRALYELLWPHRLSVA